MTREELIAFEAEVAEAFNKGLIRAPVHLSGGCEDQTLEVFKNIREQDWVFSNWRSHYHCLCKGVPRERLMADILAGKSITLNYPDFNVFSSAIVGGNLPIALGVALSIKRRGGSERVYVFTGDMTAATGIFFECAQYAMGHHLPIHFVVEDNGKSVFSDTWKIWGGLQSRDIEWGDSLVTQFDYNLSPWPHSGTGKRVEWT